MHQVWPHSAQNGANELSPHCCNGAILYMELALHRTLVQARDIAGAANAASSTH